MPVIATNPISQQHPEQCHAREPARPGGHRPARPGSAVGRLDLRDAAVQLRLAVGGTLAVLAGHGGSWVAVDVLGGRPALVASGPAGPASLLLDTAHSGTTFEIVGSSGVALVVLAAGLTLARTAGPVGRALLAGLSAVGALAATLYAGHIVALAGLAAAWPGRAGEPALATAAFLAGAVGLALLWRRFVGRGPVEWALHAARQGATIRARTA